MPWGESFPLILNSEAHEIFHSFIAFHRRNDALPENLPRGIHPHCSGCFFSEVETGFICPVFSHGVTQREAVHVGLRHIVHDRCY